MGGNVTAVMKDGTSTRAEKIPLKKIGRAKFMGVIREFLIFVNTKFEKEYGEKIWKNENDILNGFVFNGSTSFIMDPALNDEEVVKYKQSAGDLDIIVPDYLKEKLWKFLDKIEGKQITKNIKYMGSNKPTIQSIGEQINAVFLIEFDGLRVPCQVDFEFLEFEDDKPSEWAKFSHSSSFEDAKSSIKAVHHKYLLRALVGGSSIRKDIVIATSKSTPDNIILSKSKVHEIPRMLKFSVGRGVRVAYQPLLNPQGEIVEYNGKKVYQEIPTSKSDYTTSVQQIFKLAFGEVESKDLAKFYSFVGLVDLMKKYLNKKQIEDSFERYVDLLWAVKPQRAQELEVQNPSLDFEVKDAGYQYLIKHLKIRFNAKKMIETYYADYGKRGLKESFVNFLELNF